MKCILKRISPISDWLTNFSNIYICKQILKSINRLYLPHKYFNFSGVYLLVSGDAINSTILCYIITNKVMITKKEKEKR